MNIFCPDSIGLSSFSFFSVKRFFSAKVRFGRSRSSKVINFGTNRRRLYDFLLVRHSNFGTILHRFRDIAVFAHDPPLFHPNVGPGVFPLHHIADVTRSTWADT